MKALRAHGFNQRPRFEQVVGYLERNEPLPLDQPDRKATSFITSHFYLDDFVQSSEDPNPRPLQHTPLQAIPEEGFRTPAEATDEDVRLARMRQGGIRFGEDDLAGDPEADALTNNGQGPPSITGRLRSAADGQAAADLIGAGAAGLAAVQAFRSQLPQDAAEYVRLNVLPRPGPQPQPPLQIIGRPSDVERLLDEAGQRAQEVERGAAQAVEETAAVAAEEGEVAVAAGGPGRRSSSPRTHGGRGCWSDGCHGGSRRGGNGGVGRGHCRRRSLRPRARHGLGPREHALPTSAGQRGRGRAGRPVRQQHERRHSASALHTAHRQQHFGQPRKQPRLLAVRLPRAGAVQQHAASLLLGPEPVALPQSQSSRASSSSRRSLPPPSFDQLARDIEAA